MDSREKSREGLGWAHRWRRGAIAAHTAQPLALQPELQRFAELVEAFVDLARERGDLVLRGAAPPGPLGFAVRLQPEPTSAGGELCLEVDRGRLTTWSRAGHPAAPRPGERSLRLDLAGGFRWETLIFPDAERLAYTLLRWMEDCVAAHEAETALSEEPWTL